MDLQLEGKTALVTGATAGVGLGIARRLAAEQVEVVICGRTQGKLDEAANEIAEFGPVRTVLADAATAQGAATLIAAAPRIDILVNNLGIAESKAFADISDADWQRLFEINVMSGIRLARHYFPQMLSRNWGRIIFISSDMGLITPGDLIHYGMTKSAQLALGRGLADLTRGTGVTVNSVLPGPMRAERTVAYTRALMDDETASDVECEAAFFDRLRPLSLIRRFIDPDEIGAIVTYLASPLASATNGAAIRAEGGMVPTMA